MKKALVGYTGFVGTTLGGQIFFESQYNSRNIVNIVGKSYDLLVCAAAPATMWAANQNPDADKANLDALFNALRRATIGRLVLISTIAVFDDASAGYREADARYETQKAYGRNRRALELAIEDHFTDTHILRLPALFGVGLKKNFLFDLVNPVPSFIKPDVWNAVVGELTERDAALFAEYYAPDAQLNMWALDRGRLNADPAREGLEELVTRLGLAARNFTNSESRFQYFNIARLAATIETCIANAVPVLNVASEPLEANRVAYALTGEAFVNTAAPLVREDMRSDHAAQFGGQGDYLFKAADVLGDIRAFHAAQTA